MLVLRDQSLVAVGGQWLVVASPAIDLQLENKNAVVTAASKGIGRAIALRLADEGVNVAICARGEAALRATESDLRKSGVKVVARVCDVAQADALERFLTDAGQTLGGVDMLVNNASGLAPQKIRVNVVAPGSIEFPGGMWDHVKQGNRPFYDSILKTIPWGRLGTADEIATAVVFLLSPRASWITGVCLVVDGGQHKGNF
jgi:3-oxoacyl-[acyl-carrier protein] reductase